VLGHQGGGKGGKVSRRGARSREGKGGWGNTLTRSLMEEGRREEGMVGSAGAKGKGERSLLENRAQSTGHSRVGAITAATKRSFKSHERAPGRE